MCLDGIFLKAAWLLCLKEGSEHDEVQVLKATVSRLLRVAGYEIRRAHEFRADFGDFERQVLRQVKPYTMASPERVVAVIDATTYIVRASVPGVFVECGVWRGGCTMACALTLMRLGAVRDLYLFDTYAGMTEPTVHDQKLDGEPAMTKYERLKRAGGSDWCYASLEEVRQAMESTGYPMERVHLVKGPVEETIPRYAPESIAVLRLDTDWYESTRHELEHLFPRLSARGVLIIDDYGSWRGARKAVDEYADLNQLLLQRTDGQGRMAVKVPKED